MMEGHRLRLVCTFCQTKATESPAADFYAACVASDKLKTAGRRLPGTSHEEHTSLVPIGSLYRPTG